MTINWIRALANFGLAFFTATATTLVVTGGISQLIQSLVVGSIIGFVYGGIALCQDIKNQANGTEVRKMPRKRKPGASDLILMVATIF